MQAARYRFGIDARTGRARHGWAHVEQSLAEIWTTRLDSRVMRLTFGSDLRSRLAEDLTPATALLIYDDLITAAHRWEPEYRIREMQFVHLTRLGALGLRHKGIYYPEGRLGNYDIAIDMGGASPLPLREALARKAQVA